MLSPRSTKNPEKFATKDIMGHAGTKKRRRVVYYKEVNSGLAGLLLDHASRILVLASADKLRMSQPIDLRFILHPFMA